MHRILGAVITLSLLALVGPASSAGAASARRGGGTGATLVLSPDTVRAGDAFSGDGCGYTVGKPVNIAVTSPNWQAFFGMAVGADGCIHFVFWTDVPGAYDVQTWQSPRGSKLKLMASAALTAR